MKILGFTPGIMRKYVYTKDGPKLTMKRKTEFMPFAYENGIFIGINKDERLVGFKVK